MDHVSLKSRCQRGHQGVRFSEITTLKHLDPTKVRLSPSALVRELAAFVASVFPVFRQAVGS